MSNPNAAKGSKTERDITTFLQEVFGRAAYRPHQEGFKDVGDIHLSPFVLQAKNWGNVAAALNEGVKGATVQATHAGEPFGAAVIKKRGAGIAEARVAMKLSVFRDVVARLRRAEALLARYAPEIYHEQHLRAEPHDLADVLVTDALTSAPEPEQTNESEPHDVQHDPDDPGSHQEERPPGSP